MSLIIRHVVVTGSRLASWLGEPARTLRDPVRHHVESARPAVLSNHCVPGAGEGMPEHRKGGRWK
jgi:hypothetical protein